MKKLAIAVFVAALALTPAGSVFAADDLSISSDYSRGYKNSVTKDSEDNSSHTAYSSKNVSYEALYYVRYDANFVDYVVHTKKNADYYHANASAYDNGNSYFSSPFVYGGYGGGHHQSY
jgi:hypothetical protein